MLTNQGTNSQGQTHWKLHVPDEHCMPGLEVGIFATGNGLMIGGNVIPWPELEAARLQALGCTFGPRKSARFCNRHGGYGFTADCVECNPVPNEKLTGVPITDATKGD